MARSACSSHSRCSCTTRPSCSSSAPPGWRHWTPDRRAAHNTGAVHSRTGVLMTLKDKVVVVTGAARGIGREIALLMARHGALVVVNDYGGSEGGQGSSATPADEVVGEIKTAGGRAMANYDSVATMAGGQRIVKTAIDAFGRIDVVVNNAGILRDRMIFNMSEEEWDAVIDTHLKGTFSVTRAAAPYMKEQRWGRFINMTSTSGLVGNVGQANYAAAKLGVVGIT